MKLSHSLHIMSDTKHIEGATVSFLLALNKMREALAKEGIENLRVYVEGELQK